MAVFDENASETPTDFMAALVGEDKKFKTVEDLARGKWESDNYINSLKAEKERLEQELASRAKIEELIKEARTPPVATEAHQPAPATEPLSREDLAKMVRELNEEDSRTRTVAQNLNTVAAKLGELYGNEEKAAQVVKAKANELGVSVKFLQEVAAQSPKAFFAQIGITEQSKPASAGPTRSEVNPSAFTGSGPKERTYAWYQEIRRTDPKMYQKLTAQMHEDARKDGFFPDN